MPVVPHPFLFRFTAPVRNVPTAKANAFLDLERCPPLPNWSALDGFKPFAEIRAGWNDDGIGFRVQVTGKKMPVAFDPGDVLQSDGLQIWLDTRNTQSIHRAGRFCHHFVFVPSIGTKTPGKGAAVSCPIALARESPPTPRAGLLRAGGQIKDSGYTLHAWIPAEALNGYDPESNPLLGFYYLVRDAELGEQVLSVGRDFPFDHDPSLWSTLELTREPVSPKRRTARADRLADPDSAE